MDTAQEAREKFWSKCPFCGASNGLFGSQMQQHTSRCRYKGDAGLFDVAVPNYSKFLDQDDPKFLRMMHAMEQIPLLEKQIRELTERLQHTMNDKVEHE